MMVQNEKSHITCHTLIFLREIILVLGYSIT